jgi:NADPH2:quinone reductase
MQAAFYERYGSARDVLKIGYLPNPIPQPGEVLVRIQFSGINPSDCKRRQGLRDRPGYPLIIPHNDGAGIITDVGEGIDKERVGQRVWIWSGQRRRPFGTAAEYISIGSSNAVQAVLACGLIEDLRGNRQKDGGTIAAALRDSDTKKAIELCLLVTWHS